MKSELTESTISILSDAFGFSASELKNLDPLTSLEQLYAVRSRSSIDFMEFEILTLEIERELGRQLTEEERKLTKTIQDVDALLMRAPLGDTHQC
jgi:hypothetical protein